MEEFFGYCQRNNCTSRRDTKIALEIYKFINSVENAVWNDEKYELHMSSVNAHMEDMNVPVTVMTDDATHSVAVISNVTSGKEDCPNESSYQCTKSSNLIDGAVWDSNDISQGGKNNAGISEQDPLLLDYIDDDVEKQFLREVITNGDAICMDDATRGGVDFLLQGCTDSDFEQINVLEPATLHSNHDNKCSDIPEEAQHASNVACNMQSQFDSQQQQISSFHSMVQYKCKKLTATLTPDQNEVLKRSIAHYSDLVLMCTMSATEACEHVEQVMNNLLNDSNVHGYGG